MGRKTRTLVGLLLVFAIAICASGLPAFAAEDAAKIIQVSNDQSNIYLYVNVPTDKQVTKADIYLTNQRDGSKSTITVSEDAVRQVSVSGVPQSYLFLIDAYTDQKAYVDGFTTAINSLMEKAPTGSTFAVATIIKNNKIEFVLPFTSDAAAVDKVLQSLVIESGGTSLYTGLMKAIDLYGESGRDPKELCNIVVISDGIESADSDSVERQDLDKAIQAFKKGRDQNALFLIHTVQYKSSPNAKDFKDFAEISRGAFFDLASPTMATDLIAYVNDSFLVQLSRGALEWTDTPLTLTISMDLFDASGAKVGTSGAFEFVLALSESTTVEQGGSPGGGGGGVILQDAGGAFPVVPVVIGGVILVLLAVGAVLFVRSKKLPQFGKKAGDSANSGIFIQIEIVSGGATGTMRELTLTDEVFIGRDAKKCGLILQDSGVSSVHARLFFQDGIVCLEDVHSLNGTAINHMSIHAPNKLRSGDLVTIGTSSFTVRF